MPDYTKRTKRRQPHSSIACSTIDLVSSYGKENHRVRPHFPFANNLPSLLKDYPMKLKKPKREVDFGRVTKSRDSSVLGKGFNSVLNCWSRGKQLVLFSRESRSFERKQNYVFSKGPLIKRFAI